MSKLLKIINQSYRGDSSNSIIAKAKTSEMEKMGVLPTKIKTPRTFNPPLELDGILIDIGYIKNQLGVEPNIRYDVKKIKTDEHEIDLSDLEKTAKEDFKDRKRLPRKSVNKTIKEYAQNMDVSYDFTIKRNKKGGFALKINNIEVLSKYQGREVKTNLDITSLRKVIRDSFEGLLKNNYQRERKKISEKDAFQEKGQEKYTARSVTTAYYDGEIQEYREPISQTMITRESAPKGIHVRDAHKRFYRKSGKEVALPPNVINKYLYKKDLKDLGFEPHDSKKPCAPTIEALLEYRGNLSDSELRSLQEENEFRSMKEVYGTCRLDVDYNEAKKIFKDENWDQVIFEKYEKRPLRKDLSKSNIRVICTGTFEY